VPLGTFAGAAPRIENAPSTAIAIKAHPGKNGSHE